MTKKLYVEVRDSLADIPVDQWNALCQDGNPFLRFEFLNTLEATQCLGDRTGWYPRYFLLWESADTDLSDKSAGVDTDKGIDEDTDKELIGAVPAYLKTNSYGEFVFDWAWAEAYERHSMEYYPKLVSSIPFTPATGRRLLTRADQPFTQTVGLLAAAVRQFADSQKLSSAHFLFLTEAESDVLSANDLVSEEPGDDEDESTEPNEIRTASDHMRRIDVQYHWHNDAYTDFDDFLARCTAKRRKTIRRERRYVTDAGLQLVRRIGATLSEQEWRWVHQFYCATFDRKWGNPSLTRRFFEQIGQTLGEHVLIVFAYDPQDDSPDWPVACSVMFFGDSTLYGRYWGCRKEFNALHFEACYYQGIDFCIEQGIQNFEPGAQGEHKITRGFVPTITRSAHYIQNTQFRDAIADFLKNEVPYVEQRCKGLNDLLPFRQDTLSI